MIVRQMHGRAALRGLAADMDAVAAAFGPLTRSAITGLGRLILGLLGHGVLLGWPFQLLIL